MSIFWSSEETEILKNNYGTKTAEETSILLPHRTLSVVLSKAHVTKQEVGGWRKSEIKRLKEEGLRNKEIDAIMNVSIDVVCIN